MYSPTSLRRLAITLKPLRLLDIPTQIFRRLAPTRHIKAHILRRDFLARHLARTLHAGHNIGLQRPPPVLNGDIPDLEGRRVALPREAGVGIALRDVKGLLGVGYCEVAHAHVAQVAFAAAAAVGWHALAHARPGFDVRPVLVVVGGDVAHRDIFEDLEFVLELPDAAEGDAGGAVEGAVFDEDVGAVFGVC